MSTIFEFLSTNCYNREHSKVSKTMSITFTKLFSSITESTVWCEDLPTRITWICMLAMSDRKGRVFASVPGLANRARVSVEEARAALGKFLSPDLDSRTKEHEGRRIEEIDGGWRLLNHEKYRNMRDEEERKEYKREWIKERRHVDKQKSTVDQGRPPYTNAEADAEAEAYINPKNPTARKTAPPDPEWLSKFKDIYPNRAGDQGWRKALRAANSRMAEGHTPNEFLAGAARYADYCRATATEHTEFVKQASTFLGPDKPFALPWIPPAKPETAKDRIYRLNGGDRDRTIEGHLEGGAVVAQIGGPIRF